MAPAEGAVRSGESCQLMAKVVAMRIAASDARSTAAGNVTVVIVVITWDWAQALAPMDIE